MPTSEKHSHFFATQSIPIVDIVILGLIQNLSGSGFPVANRNLDEIILNSPMIRNSMPTYRGNTAILNLSDLSGVDLDSEPLLPTSLDHFMPMRSRTYYVYMLTNRGGTLYTGVTGDLFRRVWQHHEGTGSMFTARYNLNRLIWFEETDDISVAIAREKQIKAWRRKWKVDLVKASNQRWADLAAGWYEHQVT